jgi:hypothetical protein
VREHGRSLVASPLDDRGPRAVSAAAAAEQRRPDSSSGSGSSSTMVEEGTVVLLRDMEPARFNHHLAVVLPDSGAECQEKVVRLITDDHVAPHELDDGVGEPPQPMRVRPACLRVARPLGQTRLLQYGCASERIIVRGLQQRGLPPECITAVLSHLEISPVRTSHVTTVACSSQSEVEHASKPEYTLSMATVLQPGDSDGWVSGPDAALYDDEEYAELLDEDPDAPQFNEWLIFDFGGNDAQRRQQPSPPASPGPGPAYPPEPDKPLAPLAPLAAAVPANSKDLVVVVPAPQPPRTCRVQVHRVSLRIPIMPDGPLAVRRFYLQAGYSVPPDSLPSAAAAAAAAAAGPAAAAAGPAAAGGSRTWQQDQSDPDPLPTTPQDETDWGE